MPSNVSERPRFQREIFNSLVDTAALCWLDTPERPYSILMNDLLGAHAAPTTPYNRSGTGTSARRDASKPSHRLVRRSKHGSPSCVELNVYDSQRRPKADRKLSTHLGRSAPVHSVK